MKGRSRAGGKSSRRGHRGAESFRFNLRFSEALGEGARVPVPAPFSVSGRKRTESSSTTGP